MSGTCWARREAPRTGQRMPVEVLAHGHAVGRRHVAVVEAARDQLDLGAGPGERRGQRPVVGRRERRRIDQVDAHRALRLRSRRPDGRNRFCARCAKMQPALPVEISFCVVNTEQRGLLRYCLDAIARERATVDFEPGVLVLDNASQDGSAEVARQHPVTTEVIALTERRGKGVNDSALLERARGRFCLLLNEDSELEPGATVALHAALAADERAGAAGGGAGRPPRGAALAADERAGAAGAMLVRPDGEQQPSAWRFPSPAGALLTALFLHKAFVVQSKGENVRRVDWVQSAAMLVRREAAVEIGFFDPQF